MTANPSDRWQQRADGTTGPLKRDLPDLPTGETAKTGDTRFDGIVIRSDAKGETGWTLLLDDVLADNDRNV
jgi:hypothetical protein